jgi:hypothetical protein
LEYSNILLVYPTNSTGEYRRGIAFHAVQSYAAKLGVVNAYDGWSYAIETKDKDGNALDLRTMKRNIDILISKAIKDNQYIFKVPSFHLYKTEDIAPMFALAPKNMVLPRKYKDYILDKEGREWWVA